MRRAARGERRVARRYAEAFLDAAREAGRVDPRRDELNAAARVVSHTPELIRLLSHPEVPAERKRETVDRIFGQKVSAEVNRLLQLLVERGRISLLEAVAEEFGRLADAAAGLARVEVRSVVPLSEDQAGRLQAALARHLGGDVVLERRLAPDLVAGVQVRFGDQLIDGSVATRLARLRQALQQQPGR